MTLQALAEWDSGNWQTAARAARASIETRLFIDGRYVDAAKGGRFATVDPATGETASRDVGGHGRRHRSGGSRGEARFSQRRLVANGAASAHGDPVPLREPHRARRRAARGAGNAGHG